MHIKGRPLLHIDVIFSSHHFYMFGGRFCSFYYGFTSETQGSLNPALPIIPNPESSSGNHVLKEQ